MLKNFLHILKRFKTSSILNIVGLSVAFAVFSVVAFQCVYDFGYNRNFKKSSDIYLFTFHGLENNRNKSIINTPLAKDIAEGIPEISNYCLYLRNREMFDVEDDNGNVESFINFLLKSTPGMLDMFQPDVIAGDAGKVFSQPGQLMITESIARTMFGDKDPIGQTVTFHYSHEAGTVAAVCRDFPDNCSLSNGVYCMLPEDTRGNYNYQGYFEIASADADAVTKKINDSNIVFDEEDRAYFEKNPQEREEIRLFSFADIYLNPVELEFYPQSKGNINTTLSLLAIGIITLLIAFINFINFSIAMAPLRVRSLNIQKILGANNRRLRFGIMLEAVFFSILACVLSLFIIMLLKASPVATFFSADLSLDANISTLSVTLFVLIALGLLSCIYPACYITSFPAAVALSGSFALSRKSTALRNMLIIFQFVAAITLIIVSSFIKIQHHYMQNYSWGIPTENIITFNKWKMKPGVNTKTFEEEIRKIPGVTGFTVAHALPGDVMMEWTSNIDGKAVFYKTWPVDENFLDFFDISLVEGKAFTPPDTARIQYIFNESFRAEYDIADIVGKPMPLRDGIGNEDGIVQGIAADFNFLSLHMPVRPMAITMGGLPDRWLSNIMIRISDNNTQQTLSDIEKVWKNFSDEPFSTNYLDDYLNEFYQNESNLAILISIFGLVSVIIAIMGVYGLILFNARYKTKEIAIRKVNGSTIKEIMLMLNRNILLQLAVAFAVAVPLSYYIVQRWLSNFAYKTPVYWWVFLLAGLLVLVITLITISMQSYKAATANPTEALNKE